ncbi:MAG: polymer-forming cytoskeletal protein, partial [Planctomycetes bacterium]|nr:polymer-forming cytoskeletal protein [Planctomycetota bacterium]
DLVLVEDIVVKRYYGVHSIETCGMLIVTRRGHAAAQNRVIALGGIQVEGKLHCKHALCAGRVEIGSKAEWEGDLAALSLFVESGAIIKSGYFKVPIDPLEDHRHQELEQETDE